ncbi:MAG: toll/interleukin-1 receptor domain-containing protein [Alphaproteobacteria bacterium]
MANEIFISYRRSDEPRARLFYNLLKERGVEAWYDAKIEAGEDWRTSTANALDAAPIFVLLMSKTASESGDIAKELAAATHKRKLVVPVRLDDMQLEGMFLYELASRNWIDAYHNTEQRLGELADKLAALVKADMSPEAAAALDVNVAEIAAAKSKGMFPRMMQKGGSVALITAGAVALVAAAGSGIWFFTKSSLDEPPKAWTNGTAASAATATATTATAASAVAAEAPKALPTLSASMNDLAAAVKAAGRNDTEVSALSDAATKLAALNDKAASGADPAAQAQAKADMNDIALAAARAEITALAGDSVVNSVMSDFKSVVSEQKSSGVKMDPTLAKTIETATAAESAIKAANELVNAPGADGAAAAAAAQTAQQSVATLTALQPTASDAFLKAKRLSYASNSAAARSLAGQIAQFASARKPNVFASTDRKEAYKFLTATDAWARSRMAEVDVLAASVATADRKAVTKYASQAATARTELASALVKSQAAAATLAAS